MKSLRTFILFFFLIYLVWTEIQVVAGNNLYLNRNWQVGKMTSLFPLEGSYETLVGRITLSNYQLNFDKNFSNHHFISRRPESIDRLDFRFFLSEKAYLDVLYGKEDSHRLGLRLSAHPTMKGLQYHLRGDGKFTFQTKRDELNLDAGWHSCSIRQEASATSLSCDQNPSVKIQLLRAEKLSPDFSFRNGNHKVTLTQVDTFSQGQIVWSDHFNQKALRTKLLKTNGIFFLILLVVFFIYYFQVQKNKAVFIRGAARIAKHIFALFLVWLCFDFFYYSKIPVGFKDGRSRAVHPTVSYVNFENMRRSFFSTVLKWQWERPIPQRADILRLGYSLGTAKITACENQDCRLVSKQFLPSLKSPSEVRMVMLGGSLFHGSGASDINKTIFARLHHKLHQEFNTKVTSLNGSISIASISQQVENFMSIYRRAKPDILLLGFLPPQEQSEVQALEELLDYAEKFKLPVLVLKRPHNWDKLEVGGLKTPAYDATLRKHRDLVTIVELSSFSYNPEFSQKGLMWWDEYHLTDYGSEVISEAIAPLLLKKLRHL